MCGKLFKIDAASNFLALLVKNRMEKLVLLHSKDENFHVIILDHLHDPRNEFCWSREVE